jgi:Tachylectin
MTSGWGSLRNPHKTSSDHPRPRPVPFGFTGSPILAASADGRLELVVVGNDGQLYAKAQTAQSNGWTNWASRGKPAGVNLIRDPSLAASADGRLELVVVGDDGQLYAMWQIAPSGGWSGWTSRGKPAGVNLTGTPTLAASADGRLELVVVGYDGQLYAMWQTAPSGGWSDWTSRGKPAGVKIRSSPRLAASADGRLELVVVGDDGQLWAMWQTAPSGGWSDWTSRGKPAGITLQGAPMLAASADGRLELVVVGHTDGQLWAMSQNAPSGAWSNWTSRGKPAGYTLHGDPMLAASADGRLELFVVTVDFGDLYSIWQTAPNGAWSGWTSRGKPADVLRFDVFGSPGLAASADGRLELVVLGNDGQLHTMWQTAPSNGWSDWHTR